MRTCGEWCTPICDFCIWYDFNGVRYRDGTIVYGGEGECVHISHPQECEPDSCCDDFECFCAEGVDPKAVARFHDHLIKLDYMPA